MGGARKTNRYNSGQGNQAQLARSLDQLAEFESFKADILPKLRQFIKEGKTASEIYSWAQSYLAAKTVTLALASKDEKTALGAIKEALDRGVGKAADKVEITQRYEQLSDEELEALLQSERESAQDDDRAH
jgi:hypothetical protein